MVKQALVIKHLVKKYGDFTAVNDISLSVKCGSLFAFLGVNGAGKSTTINIICSILNKNSGKIYVDGLDLDENPFEIKKKIGIVFQTSVLDKDLTVKENLDVRTSFYSLTKKEKKKNIEKIVKLLELEDILNKPVNKLSGGQKRRVDIARAMVHAPSLLILDEPTTGLDPKTRLTVRNLIDKIRKETGMTVFLTTHYLEEAELATEVTIMDKGKIIARGTPTSLKNKFSYNNLFVYNKKYAGFAAFLKKKHLKFEYLEDKKAYKIPLKVL